MVEKVTPISRTFFKYSKNDRVNAVVDNPNCSFLGNRADQPFTAFYVWEKFFFKYGNNIKRFVEFGCDLGSSSVYFLLQCIKYNAEFRGYDKRRKRIYGNDPVKKMIGLKSCMRIGNGYKRFTEIKEFVEQKGMSVIFSDCVDKPIEFKNFAPMMKPGDVLVMHDWDRAIKDQWVVDDLKKFEPFKLLFEKERRELNTLTRFFLKE